jgi:N-dimethylarginine dimethylaminohydrolase
VKSVFEAEKIYQEDQGATTFRGAFFSGFAAPVRESEHTIPALRLNQLLNP